MSGTITIFPLLLLAVLLLVIPVLVGVYVYRDASRRRMNAALWTLIAVLAPSLLGFLVYLLVRGSSGAACPSCGQTVSSQFTVCPHCGTALRPACPSCAFPVEPDWKVCPRCAAPLTDISVPDAPVPPKDRSLGKILAVVLLVPLLITLILIGAGWFYTADNSVYNGVGWGVYSPESYSELQASPKIERQVEEWMDSLEEESGRAFALRYSTIDAECESNQQHYYYLIRIPGAGTDPVVEVEPSANRLGAHMTVQVGTAEGDSPALVGMETCCRLEPTVEIWINGSRIPCETLSVDYNPSGFTAQ